MNSPRLITAGYAREIITLPSNRNHPVDVTVQHFIPGDVITDAQQESLTVDLPLTTEEIALEDAYWRLHRQAQRAALQGARNSTLSLRERLVEHLGWLLRYTPKGDGRDTVRTTHEDIGRDVASTRESVSKEMTLLRVKQRVRTGYREILLRGF